MKSSVFPGGQSYLVGLDKLSEANYSWIAFGFLSLSDKPNSVLYSFWLMLKKIEASLTNNIMLTSSGHYSDWTCFYLILCWPQVWIPVTRDTIAILLTIFPDVPFSPVTYSSCKGSLFLPLPFTHFSQAPLLWQSSGFCWCCFSCIYRYDSVFCLVAYSFVLLFRFHIGMKSHGICLSLSEIFHVSSYPLGPSLLFKMARSHPFFYGGIIFCCVFVPAVLYPFIYLL